MTWFGKKFMTNFFRILFMTDLVWKKIHITTTNVDGLIYFICWQSNQCVFQYCVKPVFCCLTRSNYGWLLADEDLSTTWLRVRSNFWWDSISDIYFHHGGILFLKEVGIGPGAYVEWWWEGGDTLQLPDTRVFYTLLECVYYSTYVMVCMQCTDKE